MYVDCFLENSVRDACKGSNKIITANYYKKHKYRHIQISVPKKRNNIRIHYELIDKHVELHFEGENYLIEFGGLIEFLEQQSSNHTDIDWETWDFGYRCQSKRTIVSNEDAIYVLMSFMDFFDPLIERYYESEKAESKIDIKQIDSLQKSEEKVVMYTKSLGTVLQLPLSIPDYQRIYCWEEENVKCLLNDLFEHTTNIQNRGNYRLGTIILYRNGNVYDIIDGQQRLVTLAMLLFELGYNSNLLEQEFSSKESLRYIAYNKHLINVFIKNHPKYLWGDSILEKIDFSVLVLENATLDLAYTFFSNQNSRGVALTDYDLLKAHHLRYIPTSMPQQSERAARVWNNMIEEGRESLDNHQSPNYVVVLDTYMFHLRKWMRKHFIDEDEKYKIKREFESAVVMDSIPPFGEKFYFNEQIQGGAHFFAFVEKHITQYSNFKNTEEFKTLHSIMDGETHFWYRNVIEAFLFCYYIKFGEFCLSDALVVFMRIILQHRYKNAHAVRDSINTHASNTEIVMMIDQATSPTFVLAEAFNKVKDITYPAMAEMSPIQKRMKLKASQINKILGSRLVLTQFKKINL